MHDLNEITINKQLSELIGLCSELPNVSCRHPLGVSVKHSAKLISNDFKTIR